MKNLLLDIKTLFVEVIGLLGGIIWGVYSNWDWEPIILIAVSALGISWFILLKILPDYENRPIIDLELVSKGDMRSPPGLIRDVSPKAPEGEAYVIEVGGTYLFNIKKRYELIIRNNSQNTAYNLRLYRPNENYPIYFGAKLNSLEPVTILKPLAIQMTYEIYRPMTHDEAESIQKAPVPDDLQNFELIAEYRGEGRRRFYTRFKPLQTNQHVNRKPNLKSFLEI